MKRIIKSVALVTALLLMIVAFAGCAKTLSGTYSDKAGVDISGESLYSSEISYTFSGNKVTMTSIQSSVLTGEVKTEVKGTYEITSPSEGKYKIALTFNNGTDKEYTQTYDFSEGEENGKKYIKIGLNKYTKK